MSILAGWAEQWERTSRSHALLVSIANGHRRASSDEARDALFHFFQDAYHLKDWLRHDVSIRTTNVEDAINA